MKFNRLISIVLFCLSASGSYAQHYVDSLTDKLRIELQREVYFPRDIQHLKSGLLTISVLKKDNQNGIEITPLYFSNEQLFQNNEKRIKDVLMSFCLKNNQIYFFCFEFNTKDSQAPKLEYNTTELKNFLIIEPIQISVIPPIS